MIETLYETGEFKAICDNCEEEEIFDTGGDWKALMGEMTAAGWRRFKDRTGNWNHNCPECKDSRRSEGL